MAPLDNPHWEAVPPQVKNILVQLAQTADLTPFYLAGGTALALQLGHRISVDLDFFGEVELFHEKWQRQLVEQFGKRFRVESEEYSPFGLNLKIEDVSVGLLTYGYPLLDPLVTVEGIALAGLSDIGLMKLDAVTSRGTRKDFYDLFFIAQHVSLQELFEKVQIKFPYSPRFITNVLVSLVDFDVAETYPEPMLLTPAAWSKVKQFFMMQAQVLGEKWLEQK